jgi:hypothetical protein
MNKFGSCHEFGEGVDRDVEKAVRYYRRAALESNADGMYNFGRCLEYGQGIERDLYRAAKYYRLSSDKGNAAAENSFGTFLECGICVHKNITLAAQYYQRAAQQGHPDGANNYGFCLEHGRGVNQNIEVATKYYKFAADCGHLEAEINHRRCLRLLGQWQRPDRSSDSVSHPPSLDRLSDIFRDFLDDGESPPFDKEGPLLLRSFECLKKIPAIPSPRKVEWVWDELGRGDSSVVTVSTDSQTELIAVKTAQNQECATLIQREATILKTLKHPLVLRISDTPNNKSMIETEFCRNGSLASHLHSEGCSDQSCLMGANRIAKVIVGIAVAMRFVHSRGIIHRDLRPDNILLDFDWNVRIGDFGHSISPAQSQTHPACSSDELFFWPSIDSRYLAPECYDKGKYLQLSDVFSFGLIVYEILTGDPAIPRNLTRFEVMRSIAVKAERPVIPDFVAPFARELITDCLSQEPGERPSFDEIVDRLVSANFQLTANVNSVKLSKFVKNIEDWEAQNAGVPH